MPKRIALLILGIVLFIGAFFAYQVITGATLLSGRKGPPPTVVTTRDSKPLTFESRTSTGELRYIITAQKMEEQQGPGQFLLKNPVATFYTHDGRAITIRGDSCNIAVDQIRHVNGGVSGEPPSVRDGKLSGNIVLTISGKADANDPTRDSGDITVRFEKDLTLNGAEQVLTSPGKVQVRSNIIVFDGEGFTLNYSMDKARAENQRIEFFRIEKGNKIILKNKGGKGFSLDNAVATTAPAHAAPKPAAATQPINPEDMPTAYRLSFGKEITASRGTTSLTSDELYILFTAPSNRDVIHAASKPPDDEPIGKLHATAVPPPTLTATSTTRPLPPVDPMGEAGPEDLVVTWVGPMEMRPVDHTDMLLVDSKDIGLEAVGTPERPVKISESKHSAVAGKLWYHKADQSLELVPLPNGTVTFNAVGGTATSIEATTVACQGVKVSLDEAGKTAQHVHLLGPGTLQLPSSSLSRKDNTGVPLVATWKNDLDVDLDTLTDLKTKKVTQVARRVQLTGTSIKDADFDIAADNLDILVANLQGTSPALEHLLATGNVIVHSYKKNSSGLQAQRLEVLTAMFPTSKSPLPTKVIADGEVSAFQYAEKKATATAQATFRKQIVFGPHLEADLGPKSKSASAATQPADSALTDFASVGGGNVEVKHFLVNGGTRITIESSKGDPVNVDADKLEANQPLNQAAASGLLATLSAKDADHPVHITFGKDDITAPVILLDQNKQTFAIPVAGHFAFTPPEKKGKTATPLDIAWTKQMVYSQLTRLATFTGNVAVTTKGKASEPGSLTCDDFLEVQFRASADKSIPATDLETAGVGGLDHITAHGHVLSSAKQFDGAGNILTRMELFDVDTLTYAGVDQTLTIPGPGKLTLQDFRPEKQKSADNQSSRGTTGFTWDGKFAYNTNAGTITFLKNVAMAHLPLKPLRIAIDKDAAAPAPDAGPKKPSLIQLNSEKLIATLIRTKEAAPDNTSGSPVGLGAGGNFKLGTVSAGGLADAGAATIKMDDYLLSGYSIDFDAVKNFVDITSNSNGTITATASRSNKGMVEADEITWDLTKNAQAFDFKNPRGNFEAMSDMQNGLPQN